MTSRWVAACSSSESSAGASVSKPLARLEAETVDDGPSDDVGALHSSESEGTDGDPGAGSSREGDADGTSEAAADRAADAKARGLGDTAVEFLRDRDSSDAMSSTGGATGSEDADGSSDSGEPEHKRGGGKRFAMGRANEQRASGRSGKRSVGRSALLPPRPKNKSEKICLIRFLISC